LTSIFYKPGKAPVIGSLGFFGKEASWKFAVLLVICYAFAAFSMFGTGIGAGAFHRFIVFTGHG